MSEYNLLDENRTDEDRAESYQSELDTFKEQMGGRAFRLQVSEEDYVKIEKAIHDLAKVCDKAGAPLALRVPFLSCYDGGGGVIQALSYAYHPAGKLVEPLYLPLAVATRRGYEEGCTMDVLQLMTNRPDGEFHEDGSFKFVEENEDDD